MSDCQNVEIRELLPEYIGGALSDARRSEVSAHLATCRDCTEELELLKLVREAYVAATPSSVNVSAIVAKLPKKSARPAMRTDGSGASGVRSWRRSQAFQIAAAISFIAVGGISLAVARSFNGGTMTTNGDTAVVAEAPAISFAGGLSDLDDDDVEALLTAIENIEALPVVETTDPPQSGPGRQGS